MDYTIAVETYTITAHVSDVEPIDTGRSDLRKLQPTQIDVSYTRDHDDDLPGPPSWSAYVDIHGNVLRKDGSPGRSSKEMLWDVEKAPTWVQEFVAEHEPE